MNTPKAILIGFALVAAAVYFSRDVGPAQAARGEPKFQISGDTDNSFFKLNVYTGKVAFCSALSSSGEEWDDIVKQSTIACSKFQ